MVASHVASPCIDICRIDPATGWCEGCQRSIDEIAAWGSLDDVAKRAIWKRLPARRADAARTAAPGAESTPSASRAAAVDAPARLGAPEPDAGR